MLLDCCIMMNEYYKVMLRGLRDALSRINGDVHSSLPTKMAFSCMLSVQVRVQAQFLHIVVDYQALLAFSAIST